MVRNLLVIAAMSMAVSFVNSARILAVLPVGAKSHHRFMQPVVMAMARAGHQVVLYSPFPSLLKDQPGNLKHVQLVNISVTDESRNLVQLIQDTTNNPYWKCLDLLWNFVVDFYPEVMSNTEIKKLFSSDEKFDLIVSQGFTAQEFLLLLSTKFKAPVIGLQSSPTNNVINSALGNSLSLSHIPDSCAGLTNKMSFVDRVSNVFASLRGLYYHYNYYIPKLEHMMRQHFPDAPSIQELTKSVALVFVNDHLTADYAHPRTANIIPVAGIHVQPPRPLPQDIQSFMDGAESGVIFFSLGTYIIDELQPREYFEMHNDVFKNLKQRVLWKTRKETIEGLPPNVMTVKWAPQSDVLAHPACVLFITHGGQLSRVEALHFGVPVVSIPQFYDQHRNSEFYVRQGVGVRLKRQNLSEESLSKAIYEVLHNPSYRENMKRLSAIFRDRPMSPAESVVFWTEYVLRHSGAAHLRPASTQLRWYQLILLDVIAVLILTISSIGCVMLLLYTNILSRICSYSGPEKIK